MRKTAALILGAALLALAGCAVRATPQDGRVHVVAGFYPLQFVAEEIGGDRVGVENLTRAGAEPHDLELQPSQLAALEDADLVLYLRGFQPAVDEGADLQDKARTFDVSKVATLHGADPHVWLDPLRLSAIADSVAQRLAAIDPAHAGEFATRVADLDGRLRALDREYTQGLSDCQRHDVVTSHEAFGYLTARYGLSQIPVTGLNPDEEPGPQQVRDVARVARERGVTTIFFEALVSPKLSQTVAREIGARAAVLDPIEGVEDGATYFSVMRTNLATLRDALGCR
ncbi:metal ABC transporter substrate-binding protein [Dactylosporangium matsuzakiense]|uniref:Zinc ABC transporter substrate-binding protein n=1 Tax=Dactylosporangium matsuzakiense TaxID=53360 RepID=A0A9W6KCN1_9ACTN|nr:metal ABC transporter substrate-binding protein [Dactylosporangium matsuzakiense]UWZ42053.1 zinc ABC transporter substrate-binding protein [Dactylosporangium matsuzakiense]GLK99671.1 zinc ABC transporter substrate-binding protein [Dactylosporangium matsuzakiense]